MLVPPLPCWEQLQKYPHTRETGTSLLACGHLDMEAAWRAVGLEMGLVIGCEYSESVMGSPVEFPVVSPMGFELGSPIGIPVGSTMRLTMGVPSEIPHAVPHGVRVSLPLLSCPLGVQLVAEDSIHSTCRLKEGVQALVCVFGEGWLLPCLLPHPSCIIS